MWSRYITCGIIVRSCQLIDQGTQQTTFSRLDLLTSHGRWEPFASAIKQAWSLALTWIKSKRYPSAVEIIEWKMGWRYRFCWNMSE
ncbi:hypothetical protein NC653_027526 [Populus alba x Populus x berolinensis]|uniref:Uncharacterized protein n=1 Tax=Populus alba x Populus x berolinensis TaxID=444605 RepID=A0AAD6M5L2_9ROSI|nr:hypothetical protein NC653_027526 [Populus alba x Populus x berolinensis]